MKVLQLTAVLKDRLSDLKKNCEYQETTHPLLEICSFLDSKTVSSWLLEPSGLVVVFSWPSKIATKKDRFTFF